MSAGAAALDPFMLNVWAANCKPCYRGTANSRVIGAEQAARRTNALDTCGALRYHPAPHLSGYVKLFATVLVYSSLGSRHPKPMSAVGRAKNLVLPVLMMASAFVVLTPLPSGVIDVLLTLNIAASVLVLLTTVFVRTPLEFSVFPSLLLATTLSRLVLNVATTRLILTRANTEGLTAAGGIVRSFSQFVAADQIVVGVIVFAIIVLIQYLVITKGATRISEVSARFMLDGMPGRQMAVDADLNAGLIDQVQAQARRQEIIHQADFYGSMDGASRFIRGDAIAGVAITLVNIVGGLLIGVVQYRMSLAEAAGLFTRLTIGDGLVSQFPAFLISLAAGFLITRSTQNTDLPIEFLNQLFRNSHSLAIAAGFLFVLMFTGLPVLPLLILGSGLAMLAYSQSRKTPAEPLTEPVAKKPVNTRPVEDYLRIDPLEIEIGLGLLPLADADRGGDLLDRISGLRNRLASDMGFVLPKIRIRDNMRLDEHGYRIKIANNPVATGSVLTQRVLAVDMGRATAIVDGIPQQDPATGRPAVWIEPANRGEAESLGYVLFYPADVIVSHLKAIVYHHADELLTREGTRHLLDETRKIAPAAVEELLPDRLRLGEIQQVLQRLLRERISIRQMPSILEALCDHAPHTRDPGLLTEAVRKRLSRTISSNLRDRDGRIQAITLDRSLEDYLLRHISRDNPETFSNIAETRWQRIREAVSQQCDSLRVVGRPEILVVRPEIRRPLQRFADREIPHLRIISSDEITRDTAVESVGVASVADMLPQAV